MYMYKYVIFFLLFLLFLSLDVCNASMLECAHGCSNETGTPSCTCNPGYSLLSDGKNCEGEEEKEREGDREKRERESGERDKNVTKIKFKILLSDLFYYFYIFRY